ncbi:hypothetical protein F5Y04DRAFT_280111 [Hypomontagnella monticulosa]|nr:hypothetical protein F5Y04DRAFT_280111 [Hypomontagnella monticulosa]
MDAMLNSTQLVFNAVNNANGVSSGARLKTLSTRVHGEEYPIKTNTRIIWDDWKLSVNQTVDCAGTVVRHISTATLAPDCQETESATQYIENCQIPNLEVSATSQ